MDFHTIELFAGVGQLGEGLRAGLAYLGRTTRPVAYVEREAYAASVLAARMQEGSLDAAPVWSDVTTFNAHQWAGAVDCVVAGFPCQDLSLAGRRAGLDGKRSGLFFEVTRIARDCGARYLFLENVAGIASATATVVDEAEGTLDERAASRVLGELADLGWHAEWATLSAADVGASHGRARWFCWAWRAVADAELPERWPQRVAGTGGQQRHDGGRPETHGGAGEPIQVLDNTTSPRCDGTGQRPATDGQSGQCLPGAGCEAMGHPGLQHQHLQQREDGAEHSGAGGELAHPQRSSDERWGNTGNLACTGGHAEGEARQRQRCGLATDGGGCAVADASEPGVPDTQQQNAGRTWRRHQGRTTAELCEAPLFAPGPTDPIWPGIIQHWPHLAPALEPNFHRVVDGLAHRMDDCRPQRLKCCGNGVVAAQAAFALVGLVRRMRETT